MYRFLIFYIKKPRKINKYIKINNNNSKTYDYIYSNIYDDLFFLEKRYQFEASLINKYIGNNFKYMDVCCGTGSIFKYLNTNKAVGIDRSKYMINIAKNKNKKTIFHNTDIINISGKYDGIGSFYFGLFYNKNWKKLLFKLKSCLNKDGYLFISILDSSNLEICYDKIQYLNDTLYYSAVYENTDKYPFIIKETIETSINKVIYRHYMYNPSLNYFNLFLLINNFNVIKVIKYDKFDCNDEYLYIIKNN